MEEYHEQSWCYHHLITWLRIQIARILSTSPLDKGTRRGFPSPTRKRPEVVPKGPDGVMDGRWSKLMRRSCLYGSHNDMEKKTWWTLLLPMKCMMWKCELLRCYDSQAFDSTKAFWLRLILLKPSKTPIISGMSAFLEVSHLIFWFPWELLASTHRQDARSTKLHT